METIEDDLRKCPSFSSYSSNRLAEIATKVAAEHSGDDDFEFVSVREGKEVLPENFLNSGEIGPSFPVFNRNGDGGFCRSSESMRSELNVTVPLRKLLMEDRDLHNREIDNPPSSCSSSNDADDLENVSSGAYGVQQPRAADQPSQSGCKKSNSTGSVSKRWKLIDCLRRSRSEGSNDEFASLTLKSSTETPSEKAKGKAASGRLSSASAHELLYIRNRAAKEGDKKKLYLPYRRELVGFFFSGKSFPSYF